MRKSSPTHLRLIEPTPPRKSITGYDFTAPGAQGTLFASQHSSLLIFVDFEGLTEAELISLIVTSQPKMVVDLRLVPRFDVGTINRKLVFSLFENVGTKYFDVGGMSGAKRLAEQRLDAVAVSDVLRNFVFKSRRPPYGPIVLLADESQVRDEFVNQFSAQLDDLADGGWEVMRLPEFGARQSQDSRHILFISHATPDDNDFARWLGTQLELAGYEVWTDFEKLVGGENFWDNIEDVIRNRAAKVIVAATRLAQSRNGVLDEVNLAVSVERSLRLENFVVPLRVDDLPYDQFRANIARKNIINFSDNWAIGLSLLLRMLERDRVPRTSSGKESQLARTVHSRISDGSDVLNVPEELVLNWLQIQSLPAAINVYRASAPSSKLANISKTLLIPHIGYEDLFISFAAPHVINLNLPSGYSAKRTASLLTTEYLAGAPPELPRITRSEARKHLSNLIRQGWDANARQRGMQAYTLASGAIAWFLPDGLLPKNSVSFIDKNSHRRRKSLVGFSAKRRVHWHYALEMRLAAGDPLRFIARPHVVFSEDGKTPLQSSARMHALRRGFCKTWWNDRWRDLAIGYMAWLGGETSEVELDVGGDQPITVSGEFMRAFCPVTPNGAELETVPDLGFVFDEDEVDDVELDDEELAELGESLASVAATPEEEE